MKTIHLILAVLILTVGCNSGKKIAENNVMQKNEKVLDFLGEEHLENILNAENIKVYILDPMSAPTENNELFMGYIVVDKTNLKNKTDINELYGIINNERSYSFNNIVKNCAFIPDVAFEFVSKNDTSTLLIAFYCDVWQFLHNGKQYFEDCDTAREKMVGLIKRIFPNNPSVQNLKKENINQ